MTLIISSLLLIITVTFVGCGDDEKNTDGVAEQLAIAQSVFSDVNTNFTVKVFYEVGAAPYTGLIGITANQTWDITTESYEQLFSSHSGRTVTVPTTTGQMTQIADQAKTTWSYQELLNLGNQLSADLVSGATVTIPVIFLNGTYNGSSSILGIHLTGTHFAFVFKDVVVSVGGGGVSQRYVEQTTVVHEIGHAIGLVNNGVPMVINHEDLAHVHHTTNEDGVMYWAVESTANILTVLADAISGNRLNLFGPESLQDGRNYHP